MEENYALGQVQGRTTGNGSLNRRAFAEAQQDAKPVTGGVDQELAQLAQSIQVMEGVIERHCARIQPIILDVPTSGAAAEKSAPEVSVSHVAQRVRESRRRVLELASVLEYATSRIDL